MANHPWDFDWRVEWRFCVLSVRAGEVMTRCFRSERSCMASARALRRFGWSSAIVPSFVWYQETH